MAGGVVAGVLLLVVLLAVAWRWRRQHSHWTDLSGIVTTRTVPRRENSATYLNPSFDETALPPAGIMLEEMCDAGHVRRDGDNRASSSNALSNGNVAPRYFEPLTDGETKDNSNGSGNRSDDDAVLLLSEGDELVAEASV